MKVIIKKILPEFFDDILYRNKRFEIRKDEDGIERGDILILSEWIPLERKYTGRKLGCDVIYVFRGDDHIQDFGLKPGYCVIGFVTTNFRETYLKERNDKNEQEN